MLKLKNKCNVNRGVINAGYKMHRREEIYDALINNSLYWYRTFDENDKRTEKELKKRVEG